MVKNSYLGYSSRQSSKGLFIAIIAAFAVALGGVSPALANGSVSSEGRASEGLRYAYKLLPDKTSFTIEAWIYRATTGASSQIIAFQGTSNTSNFFSLSLNSTGTLYAATNGGANPSTNKAYDTSVETVPLQSWTHVAATVTKEGSCNVVALYLNGVRTTAVRNGGDYRRGTCSAADLGSGFKLLHNTSGSQASLAGYIDNLKVWNEALDEASIARSMLTTNNLDLDGQSIGAIRVYYDFDDTPVETTQDGVTAPAYLAQNGSWALLVQGVKISRAADAEIIPVYPVSFDTVGGSSISTQQVQSSSQAVAPGSNPTRTGYTFNRWVDSNGDEVSFPFTPTGPTTITAEWLINYNVKFMDRPGLNPVSNPDNVHNAQVVVSGSEAVAPPTITRNGYTFDGWEYDSGEVASFPFTPTSDVTITAQWLINYDVTFNTRGGSSGPGPQEVTSGSEAVAPGSNPTRGGYTFDGWEYDSGEATSFPFTPIADTVIYAKWLINYPVAFDTGDGGSSIPTQNVVSGSSAVAPSSDPTRTGFVFDTWVDQFGDPAVFPFTPTATTVITARWIEIYEVSFVSYEGQAQFSSQDVVSDSAVVDPGSSPTRPGYTFDGWINSLGEDVSFPFVPSSDTVISARWLINYEVSFNVGSHGSSVATQYVPSNSAAVEPVTAPTRDSFKFLGWYDANSGGGEVSFPFVPSSDTVVYAQWQHGAIAGISSLPQPKHEVTLQNTGVKTEKVHSRAGGRQAKVEIPAGALPDGTSLKIYDLESDDFVKEKIDQNATFLMTQIISWTATDGTVPDATADISVTITDPDITPGARVYQVMNEVVTQIGVAETAGQAAIRFTTDPLITVAITSPDAPSAVSATLLGESTAVVSWTIPSVSGGRDITGYTVTSNDGKTCSTTGSECNISGLQSGLSYTFTVVATNEIGNSSPSAVSNTLALAAAQSIALPSFSYVGPTFDAVPEPSIDAGQSMVLTGKRLDSVDRILIDGVSLTLSKVISSSLEISIPEVISTGWKSLVVESRFGKLTLQSTVYVVSPMTIVEDPSTSMEVGIAEPESRPGKVNAIAMSGRVELYARGYEGRRFSAKVAGKWLKVDSLASDFERVLRATGAGYDIKVELYIDGVLIETLSLTTK